VTHALSRWLFLGLSAVVQVQFAYTANNGAMTIRDYPDSDVIVVIPATTNGYMIPTIGDAASAFNTNLACIYFKLLIPTTASIDQPQMEKALG